MSVGEPESETTELKMLILLVLEEVTGVFMEIILKGYLVAGSNRNRNTAIHHRNKAAKQDQLDPDSGNGSQIWAYTNESTLNLAGIGPIMPI